MSRIITPPRAHEISAAGPAAVDASSAPKSHPEPMIEPTLANSRPDDADVALELVRPLGSFLGDGGHPRSPF